LISCFSQDPAATANRSLVETMIGWVQLRYQSIGFNKLKTLNAFMSKEYHAPLEETAAATLVQNIWRGGVTRRQVRNHRARVNEARALIASIHERDPYSERIFLKRVAFDPEFRRAVAVMGTGSMMIDNTVAHRLLQPRKCLETMWDILESLEFDGKHANTLAASEARVRILEDEELDTMQKHEAHRAPASQQGATMREKRAACRAIFHRVDTDMSGYIDADELLTLLDHLTDELNIQSDLPQITIEEAAFFIESMDADGNEVIDEKEFCDFMVHGMSTSPAARKYFKERSSLHHKLCLLIEGLSVVTEQRSRSLNRLYQRHADPEANEGKGGLTVESLFRLFSEAQTDDVHRWDDVQKFLMVMDEDRNGSISREEWCSYLLYGMSMTVEWRASFAARSPLHDKIVSLVEICLERSERAAKSLKAGANKVVGAGLVQ
jgi:Ca2+-binding EF-hand superfamily protein